ncbi:MAG: hypothetical protein PUD03_03300 [Lachnospiraceae bacterium]|nr:hypothetical protein [Lachnospiraceae bacterium]MDD5853110.1 hypothetical protein [Lachnospiraceae bacterium]
MDLQNKDELKQKIDEADVVLIGIGEEWTTSLEEMLSCSDMFSDIQKLSQIADQEVFILNFRKLYYEDFHSKELKKAYDNLFHMCKDKDYFLISLNYDRYPRLSGFDDKKCVYPCGNLDYLQCTDNCSNELLPANTSYDEFLKILDEPSLGSDFHMGVCPHCGKKVIYNTIEANRYCEGGYLEQWDAYMKFLQKTVNKKLCMVELGVSMRFPGIIRNAFEKTAFYNQKASLIRIHQNLIQIPENIDDRCYVKKENSVRFMGF